MSEKITDKAYEVWFDSLDEMEHELPGLFNRKNAARWHDSVLEAGNAHGYGGSVRWFGCQGGAKNCFKLISDGWPELLEELQPMIEKLRRQFSLDNAAALNVEVRRRKRRRGDFGDTLDMTRVWGGQLDTAWERPVKFPRISASQKYATIYVDAATSASTDSHDTLWRAAAAICMIEILARMGVNTEVWVGATGRSCYVDYSAPSVFRSAVRVKRFDQPLNENRMATMLSCAFYRTWIFGTYMAGPWKVTSGLAHITREGMPEVLKQREERGERIFEMGHCLYESAAINQVQQIVNALQKKSGEEAA